MDIGGTAGKLVDGIERKADWAAFFLTGYERIAEGDTQVPAGLSGMLSYFMNVGSKTSPNALNEILNTIQGKFGTSLKYKLLDAPHLPTQAFKVGAAVWLFDKIFSGVLPSKWGKLAGKVAIGSGAAAVAFPGSGQYAANPNTRTAYRQFGPINPTGNPGAVDGLAPYRNI